MRRIYCKNKMASMHFDPNFVWYFYHYKEKLLAARFYLLHNVNPVYLFFQVVSGQRWYELLTSWLCWKKRLRSCQVRIIPSLSQLISHISSILVLFTNSFQIIEWQGRLWGLAQCRCSENDRRAKNKTTTWLQKSSGEWLYLSTLLRF